MSFLQQLGNQSCLPIPRSRRDSQDLARSCQDFGEMPEITKVSPRSRQDFLQDDRDYRDLGEISKISPRLLRSRQDFAEMTEI